MDGAKLPSPAERSEGIREEGVGVRAILEGTIRHWPQRRESHRSQHHLRRAVSLIAPSTISPSIVPPNLVAPSAFAPSEVPPNLIAPSISSSNTTPSENVAQGTLAQTRASTTKVFFREIAEAEIQQYVAGGEPMDKAGAYAIQGGASRWTDRIEGEFSNVVGLPLSLVTEMLKLTGLMKS